MKNSSKGFLLYEGMIALLILMVITICFLPYFVIVQHERLTIREQQEAMMLLQEFAFLHMYEDASTFPSQITSEQQEYTLSVTASNYGNAKDLCLSWEGSNHREQNWCISTPNKE
ncbi:hypothetical protein [Salipaludibacillus sp. CF4.18]|uniref:hypothetical protein n=1 Tax=Salipaludibacillus sp. CF4.18 TaxID=3373081 RepID=UPI003EE69E14